MSDLNKRSLLKVAALGAIAAAVLAVAVVVTGAGTVLADDPSLTVRFDDGTDFEPPLRVVLDTEFTLTPRGRLFASLDQAPLLVIDGQQRLTTVSLLLEALARAVEAGAVPRGAGSLRACGRASP